MLSGSMGFDTGKLSVAMASFPLSGRLQEERQQSMTALAESELILNDHDGAGCDPESLRRSGHPYQCRSDTADSSVARPTLRPDDPRPNVSIPRLPPNPTPESTSPATLGERWSHRPQQPDPTSPSSTGSATSRAANASGEPFNIHDCVQAFYRMKRPTAEDQLAASWVADSRLPSPISAASRERNSSCSTGLLVKASARSFAVRAAAGSPNCVSSSARVACSR